MNQQLKAIYDSLPKILCQRKCQESCGPILWSAAENIEIGKRVGGKFLQGNIETLDCPYLKPMIDCTIYEVRPLICRLWGLVEKMRCPWGCVPGRWLSDDEAKDLLRKVGALRCVTPAHRAPGCSASRTVSFVTLAGGRGARSGGGASPVARGGCGRTGSSC